MFGQECCESAGYGICKVDSGEEDTMKPCTIYLEQFGNMFRLPERTVCKKSRLVFPFLTIDLDESWSV